MNGLDPRKDPIVGEGSSNQYLAGHLRSLASDGPSSTLLRLAAERLEAAQAVADSLIHRSLRFDHERICAIIQLTGQPWKPKT